MNDDIASIVFSIDVEPAELVRWLESADRPQCRQPSRAWRIGGSINVSETHQSLGDRVNSEGRFTQTTLRCTGVVRKRCGTLTKNRYDFRIFVVGKKDLGI